jgi:hypothetical protein
MDSEMDESFLKAMAIPEIITQKLADFLRDCIRASAASTPGGQMYSASQNLELLLKLFARSENVRILDLVADAITDLKPEPTGYPLDDAIMRAAQLGSRYLVERSCHDNAARGRARKREAEFLDAIERIEKERSR